MKVSQSEGKDGIQHYAEVWGWTLFTSLDGSVL